MRFDYSKLLGRIIEVYGNQGNFAIAMRLSERTMSLKLNNIRPWKDNEIKKAMKLLKLPENKVHLYFFKEEVQRTEL
jgi:hypothetical protein|nr:MAG TPA: Protein of unknown function (DUF739) [Caudoviricetes sp.]